MAYLNRSDHFEAATPVPALSDFPARMIPARQRVAVIELPVRRRIWPQNLWLYLGFAALLVAAYVRLDHYIDQPAMSLVLVMMGALPIWAAIAPRTPVRRR